MEPILNPLEIRQKAARRSTTARIAAAGKALIVYLGTGSIGAAIVAYLIFKAMGC